MKIRGSKHFLDVLMVTGFLILCSTPAFSEWSLDTKTNNMVCTHGSDKGFHSVLDDGNGGFFILWFDCRGCGDTYKDVYAQHYNRDGEPLWTANGLQVCKTEGGDKKPRMDLDGQGGIVIAWSSDDVNTGVQRIDANGNLMWPEQVVGYGYESIRCTSDGAGGIITVCMDQGTAQRVNAAGKPLWDDDPDGGLQFYNNGGCGAHLINDGAQGAIIVWYDESSNNIAMQRIDKDGNLLWGDADNPLFLNDTGNSTCPRMVSDGVGGAIVIWIDNSITSNRVYAQRINSSGEIQWAVGGILVTAQDSNEEHGLVTDSAGGAYATWSNNVDNNMYAQRILPNGTLWTAPLQLTTSGDVSDVVGKGFGMTAPVASGGFVTTWENDDGEIVAQRVKLLDNGSPIAMWGDAGIVAARPGSRSLECSRIAADSQGNALVVFRDSNSSEDIYAQRITSVGKVGENSSYGDNNKCFISTLFE